jgi:hypothetical protein
MPDVQPESQHLQGLRSQEILCFVALSGKERRVDAATRRRIHSHAQANFRRRNPQHQRRRTTVELDVAALVDGKFQNVPTPVTFLDASRLDPFETLPIVGGRRGYRLWDHGKFWFG